MASQDAVTRFLSDPASYSPRTESVERVDTHGAHVFLAGDRAIKIKRAVRYPYLDFSTLERRRAALEREFELNHPNAPEIYQRVTPISVGSGGGLHLGEGGEIVEWALVMRRFEQSALLSRIVMDPGLVPEQVKALGDVVFQSHRTAPVRTGTNARDRYARLIDEITDGLAAATPPPADLEPFRELAAGRLAVAAGVLSERADAGFVRRCHGDLHLDNIVMWNGRPTLFDSIEFDEDIATIDTLYDLAFLLMDLDAHGRRDIANQVLARYLWRSGADLDLAGLVALPLFLALRSAIRVMVGLQRAGLAGGGGGKGVAEAAGDLGAALGYLRPAPPVLVAVGGFSGTGKSTLASALAPSIGAAPGAVHLRSDLERKSLFGAGETDRLDAAAYAMAANADVYAALGSKARLALRAGHAVVVDAVFSRADERADIEAVAARKGIPFLGLWLDAAPADMARRVAGRVADASDATPEVVQMQVDRGAGDVGWTRIDACGSREATLTAALHALGRGS